VVSIPATETLFVWAVMAFALWIVLLTILGRAGLKGAAVVAATLSWLVARALLWWFPLFIHWARAYFEA
jgi:hypothetical protein